MVENFLTKQSVSEILHFLSGYAFSRNPFGRVFIQLEYHRGAKWLWSNVGQSGVDRMGSRCVTSSYNSLHTAAITLQKPTYKKVHAVMQKNRRYRHHHYYSRIVRYRCAALWRRLPTSVVHKDQGNCSSLHRYLPCGFCIIKLS